MTKRSASQSSIDNAAFPVRVLIIIPSFGLGVILNRIHVWLNLEIGPGNHAVHTGSSFARREALALYFRSPDVALAFCDAFPELELADGTRLPGYSSLCLPFGRLPEDETLCNLYSLTRAQDAMRQLFAGLTFADRAGNLAPGEVYPNQLAAVVRHADGGGLELVKARWGMPSPKSVLKTARDPGVTNVRNLSSSHWRRWLGTAHRCLVPLTSFAEPDTDGNQWFAPANEGQPMFFAGIEVRGWQSVRKVRDGPTTDDLFAFLTCAPNAEVGAVHPTAMPVILTKPAEWEAWLTAPTEIAMALQRSLPDGALRMVREPP